MDVRDRILLYVGGLLRMNYVSMFVCTNVCVEYYVGLGIDGDLLCR